MFQLDLLCKVCHLKKALVVLGLLLKHLGHEYRSFRVVKLLLNDLTDLFPHDLLQLGRHMDITFRVLVQESFKSLLVVLEEKEEIAAVDHNSSADLADAGSVIDEEEKEGK